MELNDNIHSEHEHASTSMKVVLLVFALALVGVLGYLVISENRVSYDEGEVKINFGSKKTATPELTVTATTTVSPTVTTTTTVTPTATATTTVKTSPTATAD